MLVDYASDENEDTSNVVLPDRDISSEPPTKRRKALPSLPSTFETVNPRDDPLQHQGRKRSRPYVDGDYYGHVYLTLPVSKGFTAHIRNLVKHTQTLLPSTQIHSFLTSESNLHISLTHPLPLRRSQLELFRSDLTQGLKANMKSFDLSLVGGVKVYCNGRKYGGEGSGGRAFLALRVGAGASEINTILEEVVHPLLVKLHLPLYHTNPEFHASFAWCFVEPDPKKEAERLTGSLGAAYDGDMPEGGAPQGSPITEEMLREANSKFGSDILSAQPRGGWNIAAVQLKIGKEVTKLDLVT